VGRSFLLGLGLLLASSANGEELYVPLAGSGTERSVVTSVGIVNASGSGATVALELVEAVAGPDQKSTTITLGAGETVQWLDVAGQLFQHEGSGVLRIAGSERLVVTAVNHYASFGGTSTVPVLDARDAMDAGAIATNSRSKDSAWQSGIGIVNPGSVQAVVTVFIHRGDEITDTLIELPPQGSG
jgi:hypothetical protein